MKSETLRRSTIYRKQLLRLLFYSKMNKLVDWSKENKT